MRIVKYEDLDVWKLSLKMTKMLYDLTAKREFSRDFALRDQLRRSIISVSSNIVEGFEKNNNNEFIRYLRIAKGSVGEARNQLYIALTVNYITQEEFDGVNASLLKLANQIGRFISYLVNKRKTGHFPKTR